MCFSNVLIARLAWRSLRSLSLRVLTERCINVCGDGDDGGGDDDDGFTTAEWVSYRDLQIRQEDDEVRGRPFCTL